jgi:sec-independent protein translocase protein TatA
MAFENVLIILVIIGIFLFGSNKIPELARALGKARSEFERGKAESASESRDDASKNR